MYVADLDLTQDYGIVDDPNNGPVQVPPMDTITGSRDSYDGSDGSDLKLVRANRVLQEELDITKSDLAEANQNVQRLQIQLADKDRTLQSTKADLIETRLELQRTDDRLKEVETRLQTATNERSEYRQYLLEAQQELQQTRTELLEWSEGLVELKSVMEGLDDDLSDLFGDGSYQAAVSEAMQLAEGMQQKGQPRPRALGDMSALMDKDDGDAESIAQALQGLTELSAEVLRQAEEDRRLFEQ